MMPRKAKTQVALTPLDMSFEDVLFRHRDFGQRRSANWDELHQVMNRSRREIESDATLASQFAKIKASCICSPGAIINVLRILEGTSDTNLLTDICFDNLKPLSDGSVKLIAPEPGFYKGANISQLSQPVCEALESYIIPSHDSNTILPNFFVEAWWDCSQSLASERQSFYVGCICARAMQTLQSYQTDLIFDGNAYSIAVVYHHKILKLYSINPTDPGDRYPARYNMDILSSFSIDDVSSLRAAVTAYRNLRDWAKEKRDEFIRVANEKVILTISPI